ncbi:hypothetical protein WME98_50085 [Sorangium sp. So ce296]|uniref:hypothetical protein n=1 Tax=Sorangium sp. So ce296 TaxID=3133296 RepID=UPI003F64385F
MAGRIRTIKPELLEDERTASLSHPAWRLFVSLLLLADDHGRFRANAAHLLGAAFWAAPADVAAALGEIETSGLVRIYKVRGQSYGLIKGWTKHQRVDRPGPPRCPGPDEADAACAPCATDSRIDRESVANPSRADRGALATDLDLDLDPDHDRDRIVSAPAATPEPVGSAPPHDPTPESSESGEGSHGHPGTGDKTAPPSAAAAPRTAPADQALQLVPPAPKEGRRKPKAKPEVECPSSDATGDEVEAFLRQWQITGDEAEVSHFLDHHRSKGSRFRDWGAAWRTWQRNGQRFGRIAPRPATLYARGAVDDRCEKFGLTRDEAEAEAKLRTDRFMSEEVEPGVTRGQQIERREREYRETGTLKEAPF